MPWFFLGAIVLIIVLVLLNAAVKSDSVALKRGLRWFASFVAASVAIWFATRTQFYMSVAMGIVSVALLAQPLFPRLGGGRRDAGQSSQVETEFLRVTIDQDNGDIDGIVLSGRFTGQRLGELTRTELTDLFEQLKVEDEEGARLLDAYMARGFEEDWEGERAAANDYGTGGEMTLDEAHEILGLQPGAKVDEIKEAHRRLMKKFHPDQGGSTYFAARINQAKDLLLST